MEIKRYTLDRKPVSSVEIESRQDFSKILTQKSGITSLIGKKLLYFGSIGLASVVAIIAVAFRSEEASVTIKKEVNEQSEYEVKSQEKQSQGVPNVNLTNNDETIMVESNTSNISSKEFAEVAKDKDPIGKVVNERVEVIPMNIGNESEKKQVSTPPIEKVTNLGFAPALAGVELGTIYADDLRENAEMTITGMLINSFSITFYGAKGEVTYAVDGTKIPESVLSELIRYNKGFEFTLTEIKATNKNGNLVTLPSMRLILR